MHQGGIQFVTGYLFSIISMDNHWITFTVIWNHGEAWGVGTEAYIDYPPG